MVAPAEGAARGGPLAAGVAVLIVAAVVPLALLQLPNLLATELPASALARMAGHGSVVGLVRASGLALPVMACVAPVAAVLARRRRAWPVLLAGLLAIGAADLLADSVHSALTIGADRALHGLGAGFALPATLALAWERPPRWCRLLARWWVVVMVISLFGVVPVMRDRLAGGDWRAALQPFPWLTAVGLAATALYVALAGGAGRQTRSAVTPAERSQLALLAVPVLGLGALDVGVSNQNSRSVAVAAGVAVVVLAALAMVTSSDPVTGGARLAAETPDGRRARRRRLCFPLIAACAGFALGPTLGQIATLRPLAGGPDPALRSLWLPLAAAVAGCLLGTAVAWLTGRHAARQQGDGRTSRAGAHAARHKSTKETRSNGGRGPLACVIVGLICAAAGLAIAHVAGPAGGQHELAVAYALIAGGLTLALSAAVAEATPAGAMSGVSLSLAGALTGYLLAGAIQIRMVGALASSSIQAQLGSRAVAQALTRAANWWDVAAAAGAVVAAAGVFLIGRARRGPEEVASRG
ncbi:MAG TPA: hypothetical protein VHY58_10520 [Streptosporangiaceae bacterium]|nr:hypothetical protein [Streptosporangiaceae bacterium]